MKARTRAPRTVGGVLPAGSLCASAPLCETTVVSVNLMESCRGMM